MIVVSGTVRIDPAKREAAHDIMQKMITESRKEDGCNQYAYAIDVLDPSVVRVYEEWRDRAALEAHFRTPHLAEWRQAWPALGISDRKLQLIEVAASSPL